jgi:hypothetical protein
MTVDFSISLKFLGPENFICTRMTIPYYPPSVVEDFTGNGLFWCVNLTWPGKLHIILSFSRVFLSIQTVFSGLPPNDNF